MAKEKQAKKLLTMALAASMATSAIPVTAFAEGEGGTSSTVTNADGSTTTTTTNADGSTTITNAKSESGTTTTESTTTSADGNTVSNTTATDDGAGNTSSTTTTTTNNGSSTVIDVTIENSWNNTVDNLAGNDTDDDGEGTDAPAEGGSSDETIADVNGNGVIDDLDKFVAEHNPGTTNTDTTNTTGSETETKHTETKNNENKDPLEKSGSTTGSETVTQTQTTVEKTTETIYEFNKDWELTGSTANPKYDKDEDYTDDTDYVEDTNASTGPTATTPSIEGGNAYIDATDGDLTVTLDGSQVQIKKDANGNPVYDANGNPVYEPISGTTTTDDATTDAAYAALVNTVKNGLTKKLATELGVRGTSSGENVTFEKEELVNVGTPAEGEEQKQDKVVTKVTLQPIKNSAGEVTGFETVKEVYTIPYNYFTTETPGAIVEDESKQKTTVEYGTLLRDENNNPVLDAETGRPIMLVPVLDTDGNPVLDADGKPVMQKQVAPATVSVTGGTPVVKLPELNLPDVGETVDEVTGDKTTVTVDPVTGDKTYVTEEAATGYKKVMTVEPKLAEDGTQIGWIKNTVIYNGDKKIGGGQETILGTVTYTETTKKVEQATTVDKYGTQLVETTKQIDKVVTTETINITATERQLWAEMLMRLGAEHGDAVLQQMINPNKSMYDGKDYAYYNLHDLRLDERQWDGLEHDAWLNGATIYNQNSTEDGLQFTGFGMWSSLKVADKERIYTDVNGNGKYDEGDIHLGWDERDYYTKTHNTRMYELTQHITDENGKVNETVFYAYCAELGKSLQRGAYYEMVNIDDAAANGVYTFEKEDAKENITAIAINGFWGTNSGLGSLSKMKSDLETARLAAEEKGETFPLTAAQINNLTEGQALTATQAAIWHYGNANDSGLSMKDGVTDNGMVVANYYYNYLENGNETDVVYNTNADNADNAAVVGLVSYLTSLVDNGYKPPKEFNETNIFDTEDIVATSITAKDKATDENGNLLDVNKDGDNTNDVYNADVSFTLAITPDYSKGDNYDVHVFDQNGNKVKTVSLKNFGTEDGTSKDGDTYTMSMQLAEGVNVTLNIDGVQNLNKSVYLYTSEPIEGVDNHSQTFVGLAGGQREVNLNMDLKFRVDEPTVTATGSTSSRKYGKTAKGDYTNSYHAQNGNVVALVEVTKETVIETSRVWNEEYEETWTYNNGTNNKPEEQKKEETKKTETKNEDPGKVLGDEEELLDIGDEEAPLDELLLGDEEEIIAATGDSNHMAGAFGGMFAALAGMLMLRKKKEN